MRSVTTTFSYRNPSTRSNNVPNGLLRAQRDAFVDIPNSVHVRLAGRNLSPFGFKGTYLRLTHRLRSHRYLSLGPMTFENAFQFDLLACEGALLFPIMCNVIRHSETIHGQTNPAAETGFQRDQSRTLLEMSKIAICVGGPSSSSSDPTATNRTL